MDDDTRNEVPVSKLEIRVAKSESFLAPEANKNNTNKGEFSREKEAVGRKLLLSSEFQLPAANSSLATDSEGGGFLSLDENEELVYFTCSAFDGSPAPTISWSVSWQDTGTGSSSEGGREKLLELANGQALSLGAARLEARAGSSSAVGKANGTNRDDPLSGADNGPSRGASEKQEVAVSHLLVAPLSRQLHGARVACRSSQTLLLPTDAAADRKLAKLGPAEGQAKRQPQPIYLSKWVQLGLKLRPTHIEILSEHARPEVESSNLNSSTKLNWVAELSEGQSVRFVCSSRGSQPAARLRWSWRSGGSGGSATDLDAASDSSTSASVFELKQVDGRRHHLAQLVCSAANPELLTGSHLEAKIKFLVKFKPSVSITQLPAAEKDAEDELEHDEKHPLAEGSINLLGSRATLSCSVQANPPINQLVWLVNGRPLAKVTYSPLGAAAAKELASSGRSAEGENRNSAAASSARLLSANRKSEADFSGGKQQETFTNWTMTPLVGAAIDGSKYLIEAHELTVINLTTTDQRDEYKCLASSHFGQGQSDGLKLSLNYRPVCLRNPEQTKETGGADATLGLGLEFDAVWRQPSSSQAIAQNAGSPVFSCKVDAQPEPTRYSWWFVPIGELLKFAASRPRGSDGSGSSESESQASRIDLLKLASSKWDSSRPELDLNEPLSKGQPQQSAHGLVLCRARNSLGWQVNPCANLLLPADIDLSLEPSAGNCSIEPKVELEEQSVLISVDCSRTLNRDNLLFQLAIARTERSTNGSESGEGESREAGSGLDPIGNGGSTMRLLFTEPANRVAQFQLSALVADEWPWAPAPLEAQRKSRRGPAPSHATLAEQVELLGDLVFSIRASDLRRSSEPRAIRGSELRRTLEQRASGSWPPVGGSQLRASPAQVLRSTGGDSAAVAMDQQPPGAQFSSAETGSSGRAPHTGSSRGSNAGTDQVGDWRKLETDIAIAAVCGTALLSALTLTLIVLLLRGRRAPAAEPPRPSATPIRSSSRLGAVDEATPREPPRRQLLLEGPSPSPSASFRRPPSAGATVDFGQVDYLAPPVGATLGREQRLYVIGGGARASDEERAIGGQHQLVARYYSPGSLCQTTSSSQTTSLTTTGAAISADHRQLVSPAEWTCFGLLLDDPISGSPEPGESHSACQVDHSRLPLKHCADCASRRQGAPQKSDKRVSCCVGGGIEVAAAGDCGRCISVTGESAALSYQQSCDTDSSTLWHNYVAYGE